MIECRVSSLRKKIEKQAAVALIFNPADIFYLIGVDTYGVLIVQEEKIIFFSPSVNYIKASGKIGGMSTAGEISVADCESYRGAIPWNEIASSIKTKKIIFDPETVSHKTYVKIRETFNEVVLLNGLVADLRIIKDLEEQKLIRTACAAASNIINSINIDDWRGKKESELVSYLDGAAWTYGCSGRAFCGIVAAGKNSAEPHHFPSEDYIKSGWLVVDFGVKYKGYVSDLTRTFILSEFVNDMNSEKLLSAVKKAKDNSVNILRDGVKSYEVYDAAREILEEFSLNKYFIHGLGHGVGIEVHEKPYLSAGDKTVLRAGMVVTIEPGFYIPDVGGMRLEDTYLITNSEPECLTS